MPLIFSLLIFILASFCDCSSWTRVSRSESSTILRMTVALKHQKQNLEKLERTFWDVSDPSSPSYTQHLTASEVMHLSKPSDETLLAVSSWLRKHNVSYSPGKDFAFCTMTVADAELLLPGATYDAYEFKIADGIERIHRTINYTLPPEVREHIDFVSPTTRFPLRRLGSQRQRLRHAELDWGVDRLGTQPSSIRSLYGLGSTEATGVKNNTQQVAGFLGNYFSPSDLQTFFNEYYPAAKGRKPTVVGPNNPGNPATEGSLDVQYIMSIGANVSTTYWYTSGQRPYPGGENEPFVDWLTEVVALPDESLPTVVSVSYADEENVIDAAFADRVDVEFQKLGVRGTSLLFGSGDNGVTGDKGACPKNSFVPWWPASSPFVTAVGATEEYEKDQAATFSGGGFSDRYKAPAFQRSAIEAYLKNAAKLPPSTFYNHTGAGFPDVAAVGMNFWVVNSGIPDEVGGTSAATPTFAGIVSLLNDARMASGRRPLGHLNQLFYKHPEVFTDVTRGSNPGGGGCGVGGFTCSPGWDPVSGLGTPWYPSMLKLVMSLPSGESGDQDHLPSLEKMVLHV
eukprot:TRINITY_DN40113_c0_g1_i1.p1 TRINITY_DN40113_c0_g1~~TRINITY_DN40113_c0_g1_i1.p1  ORF type:complete len:568 (-),score=86.09 TRINITY_DN40113_c0_g1_i1:139-1842(-)